MNKYKKRIDNLSEAEAKTALQWFVDAWVRLVVPTDFVDIEEYINKCELIANHYLNEALKQEKKHEQNNPPI